LAGIESKNVLSEAFARRQIEIFEDDSRQSRPVTLQAWRGRPWQEKALERAASLFGSQL